MAAAAFNRETLAVSILVEAGALIEAQDNEGLTALA